jgi:hypothetical protein
MNAEKIIEAVQTELQWHSFDTFADEQPLMARGGNGVVVSGCPAKTLLALVASLLIFALPASAQNPRKYEIGSLLGNQVQQDGTYSSNIYCGEGAFYKCTGSAAYNPAFRCPQLISRNPSTRRDFTIGLSVTTEST